MLLLVALACLVFQLRMPGKAIAESDYQAVAAVLAAEAKPGDVVLLHPWWTERARLFVPEGIPVAGWLGSDAERFELNPRIWLLSEPAMPRAGLSGFLQRFAAHREERAARREFGGLTLQLFENLHYFRAPTFDAREALATASVWLENDAGQRSPCQWDGKSHRCSNGAQAQARWHEVKFQPRKCIQLNPPGGGAKLVVEFSGVPAAEQLALRAAMTWDRGFFHMPELTTTEVGLEINGAPAPSLQIPAGVEGLQALDGPPIPAGATVRVWSRSPNPAYRELCVELYGLTTRTQSESW